MVELQKILSAILVDPLFVRTYIDIRIRNGGDKMGYSEGLISLAVDLALVGEQVELARIAMTRLADKGYSLSSPEMLEANETFSKLSNQFLALQEQYETYRDELLRNQKTSPALSQKID